VAPGGRLSVPFANANPLESLGCGPRAHAGAAKPRPREETVAQLLAGRIELRDTVTPRAVDRDLEPEGRDVAERSEGQGDQHGKGRAAVGLSSRNVGPAAAGVGLAFWPTTGTVVSSPCSRSAASTWASSRSCSGPQPGVAGAHLVGCADAEIDSPATGIIVRVAS
jgi:hypothetical protein